MRYMLLIYESEAATDEPVSPEAMAASYAAHGAYYGEVAQRGILQLAERLRPTALATTVRVQDGQVLVTDGPFAETKERLGGINIEYASKRESQRLGPMRLFLLPPQSWLEWDRQRLKRTGGTLEQYKHPCLIADPKFRDSVSIEQEIVPPLNG